MLSSLKKNFIIAYCFFVVSTAYPLDDATLDESMWRVSCYIVYLIKWEWSNEVWTKTMAERWEMKHKREWGWWIIKT